MEALSITSTGLAATRLIHLGCFEAFGNGWNQASAREMFREKLVDADARAKLQEQPVRTVTCNYVAGAKGCMSSVHCSTMDGDVVGTYEVPPDQDPFGTWLWKEVSQAVTRHEGRLCLMSGNGEIFWREQDPFREACETCKVAIGELDEKDDQSYVIALAQSYLSRWTDGFPLQV